MQYKGSYRVFVLSVYISYKKLGGRGKCSA